MSEDVFTPEEVLSLNDYQAAGVMHPFTCGGGRRTEHPDGEGILVATTKGWVCPFCDYRQNWAHVWMKDGLWKKSGSYQILLLLHERSKRVEGLHSDLVQAVLALKERCEMLAQGLEQPHPDRPPLPASGVMEKVDELLKRIKEYGMLPEAET